MSSYRILASWYDRLTEDVDYDSLYEYLRVILKRRGKKPRRVLDMACGTGTFSVLFAENGYETIGVDLSAEMIAIATEKLQTKYNGLRFFQGDMKTFVPEKQVDLEVCMLDSFNYLRSPEEGVRAIRCFYESLTEDGILVFDIRPPQALKAFDGQLFMDETEDIVCIWRTEFDQRKNQCFYGIDLFAREESMWERHQEEHVEYAFEPEWIVNQLSIAGFQNIELYGERTFLPPQEEEERIFIIAERGKRNA